MSLIDLRRSSVGIFGGNLDNTLNINTGNNTTPVPLPPMITMSAEVTFARYNVTIGDLIHTLNSVKKEVWVLHGRFADLYIDRVNKLLFILPRDVLENIISFLPSLTDNK